MAQTSAGAPESRIIRVFLSSTFRDFMEERDLLVRQVFPELRRKARERGVEVVEVDLRWGITEEESRQGKVLPICLAEINRCRPYFVGMLGERYGWVPPDDEDNRTVLTDQPWVEPHLGRRSVTELEILHGVLNNPEMAGRAFFYFRDPAWSHKQTEPGFVCDSDEEAQKLAELKQRILDSGFPLVKDLADPEALVNRIGADLWALIEEQFPDMDQPDALEREDRKHASYRRARTELYEDGGVACVKVSQLEQWIAAGEQRILITGDSGAGKSALIANWMQQHQLKHPEDVVFAHHLGCSNDANALDAMLARMVQMASKLLAEELPEPFKIPQDYWELVTTVTDTLGRLSSWCKRHGRRWIWVLDGLDRLPEENQQALPWLPLELFPHLHVVISALDCRVRTIIQEREYVTLTIGPLELDEQKSLIKATMRRYNKTLNPELEEAILGHEQARSPLYLRVLLDELRVCGRHETLDQQLDDLLRTKTIDGLYVKVLKRLEADVGRDAVHKIMTALWASRTGLSESELLDFTRLAQLQWATIDLGLEGSFGKNRNRIVFDHEFLRIAVQNRYLPSEQTKRQIHSELAEWLWDGAEWDERKAEELPWQLLQAKRISELEDLLEDTHLLKCIVISCGPAEAFSYWIKIFESHALYRLESTLEWSIDNDISNWTHTRSALAEYILAFIELLEAAGSCSDLTSDLLNKLICINAEAEVDQLKIIALMIKRASALRREGDIGSASQAIANCNRLICKAPEGHIRAEVDCMLEKARILNRAGKTGLALSCLSNYHNSHRQDLRTVPLISATIHAELASLHLELGHSNEARTGYSSCLEERSFILGSSHPATLEAKIGYALSVQSAKGHEEAMAILSECSHCLDLKLGEEHPLAISARTGLAESLIQAGQYANAESIIQRRLGSNFRKQSKNKLDEIRTFDVLGSLCEHLYTHYPWNKNSLRESISAYGDCLELCLQYFGSHHNRTNLARLKLAIACRRVEASHSKALSLFKEALSIAKIQHGWSSRHLLEMAGDFALDINFLISSDRDEFGHTLNNISRLYQKSIEKRIGFFGTDHPDMSLFSEQFHKYTQSQVHVLAQLISGLEAHEPSSAELGIAFMSYAIAQEAQGNTEKTLEFTRKSIRYFADKGQGWQSHLNWCKLQAARLFCKLDHTIEAKSHIADVKANLERLQNPDEDDIAMLAEVRALSVGLGSHL